MLTKAEEEILVAQMKLVFQNFIETDKTNFMHAIVRLSVDSVNLVVSLEQLLLDAPDDASCAPPVRHLKLDTGFVMCCPHCGESLGSSNDHD